MDPYLDKLIGRPSKTESGTQFGKLPRDIEKAVGSVPGTVKYVRRGTLFVLITQVLTPHERESLHDDFALAERMKRQDQPRSLYEALMGGDMRETR